MSGYRQLSTGNACLWRSPASRPELLRQRSLATATHTGDTVAELDLCLWLQVDLGIVSDSHPPASHGGGSSRCDVRRLPNRYKHAKHATGV